MHLCLFEDSQVSHFSPLTLTRGVYQIRTGACTNLIRIWERFERPSLSLHARTELASLIRSQTGLSVNQLPEDQGVLFVNGRVKTLSPALILQLKQTARPGNEERVFLQDGELIAAWAPHPGHIQLSDLLDRSSFEGFYEEVVEGASLLHRLWNLIDGLEACLREDLVLLRSLENENTVLDKSIFLINPSDIFVSPNAKVAPGAVISAADGPVFIDKDAEVMEMAIVKGPVYVGQRSVIKPRADVAGSALGPVCKAGGEVKEVIFHSYSNKAHEGFLGHSYMSSWCNIGAGTNVSNLKNDYSETTLFNDKLGIFEKTGRQFLGVIMADHSRLGISSMVNTASVIGVSCNLFGNGFLPRHLPSFSWGSPDSGFAPYRLDKAFEAMRRVMSRRSRLLSDAAAQRFENIFNETYDERLLLNAGAA